MDPKKVYDEHLPTIRRIAASVARRGHLNPQESEDFVQEVCVRIYEDDCGIIRKFKGESSFSTYLTTVITRLLHQRRVEEWGKWRPSAEAKRIGDKAILLERLLFRDGYSFHEAVYILTTPAGSQFTIPELEAIYIRLPHRNPRPMEISSDVLPDAVAVESDAHDRVERGDREQAMRRAARTIDDILKTLPSQDRLMLLLRFWYVRKVPEIARVLHMDQKKIYKRLDQLYVELRRGLERAGVSQSDVAGLLVHGDQELRLELVTTAEIASMRLSNESGEGARGGQGGLG
ncbi:MAG TPA: sigma-70 family RNA polymerase sigma factor [Thermoanaerobaculia bacterium]|jgi:RNA polymerase sigma factor (sigma-70 family)|nr:sigma-70 family RNA polymerase sigma factor [Thermoanaerobaculia bacterium]